MTGSARPGWRIDDVLARTDLAGLLDDLAQPAMYAVRGRRWHCPLPDHDDHHASVTIHTDHRGHERWRCWSGDNNHRGDAIDLVAVTRHVARPEALDWLAQRSGMIPDHPLPSIAVRKPTSARVEVPLDPAVVRYVGACEKILWGSTGRPVREWLNGRGFSDDLLRANRVGADPGRQMMQRQRGLPYGGSIGAVFPALDERGEVAYVQTRYLSPGSGPRYDNPAAGLATNPRLAWTQVIGPAREGQLVVCEGIPDALTAAGSGYQAVAVLGSQSSDRDIAHRIGQFAEKHQLHLALVVDNDPAGLDWGQRLQMLLSDRVADIAVITPPNPGMDLNEWSLSAGSGIGLPPQNVESTFVPADIAG